jgi:hypothetical protein
MAAYIQDAFMNKYMAATQAKNNGSFLPKVILIKYGTAHALADIPIISMCSKVSDLNI